MPLRCITLDDEPLALRLLASYISKVPSLELAGQFQRPLEAMAGMASLRPDVLFLDIQMPDLTGLELIRTLPLRPHIILTTAYAQYAVDGFDLEAVDYLLKPFSFERFLKAVNRIPVSDSLPVAAPEPVGFITVRADKKIIKVQTNDILFVEALGEYVGIHTATTGQRLVTYERLANLESRLPGEAFMRVHRSYLVNLSKVTAIDGNQLEIGKHLIPFTASQRDEVLRRFQQR